jgi:hypothetical protein
MLVAVNEYFGYWDSLAHEGIFDGAVERFVVMKHTLSE